MTKREQQKHEEYVKLISPMTGKTRIVGVIGGKDRVRYHFSHNKRTVIVTTVGALLRLDLIVAAPDKTNQYSLVEYVLSKHGRSFFVGGPKPKPEPKLEKKELDNPTQHVTLREFFKQHDINMDTPSGFNLLMMKAIKVDGYAVTDPKMLDMKIYEVNIVTINNRML